MGYAWNGVCYETAAQGLDGFVRSFPTSTPSGILTFTGSAPSVSGSGLISFQSGFSLISGSGNYSYANRSGTLQLPSCDYQTLGNYPAGDIVFLCSMVFAAFVGFRTGFRP